MEDVGDYGAGSSRSAALARKPIGAVGSGLGLTPTAPPAPPRPNVPRSVPRATSTGSYTRSTSRPQPPPAASPGPMDINAFLGADTGYQDQLRQLAAALSNFNADVTRRTGSINTDFGFNQKAMDDQKIRDLESLEADYASRGVLRSGLYGKAVGDYNTEFNQRVEELLRNRDQALNQLTQESSNFQTQQSLAQQAAREAALRRRAEGLGI